MTVTFDLFGNFLSLFGSFRASLFTVPNNSPHSRQHVLLECERWTELRREVWGERRPDDLKKILNKPELAQKAAKFMVQTGLLGQFRAVQAAPDEVPI